MSLNLFGQNKYLKDIDETQALSQKVVNLFATNKTSQSFSITTFLATTTIIQGGIIRANASTLRDINYNYNRINLGGIGEGVYIIDVRISAPAFGGMGSNNYHIYDRKTNEYLGSYKN
jgi:hypothetical protein